VPLPRYKAPAPNSSLSSQKRLRLLLWNNYLHPVRLYAALGCSRSLALPGSRCTRCAHIPQEWRGRFVGAGGPCRAVLNANTTPASDLSLTTSKAT